MKVVAFIFARGGSKGLPGKNIRLLDGKPLIAWSIQHALSIDRIGKVIVSTDSAKIAKIAIKYGAEVPFLRPKKLAEDDSPEWLAWRHAVNYLKESHGELPDVFISLPPTSPLRSLEDIERCIDEFEKGGADIVVTATDSFRNPYFNMIKKNSLGNVELVNSNKEKISRRQEVPTVFDITTVCYAANPKFILARDGIFEGNVRMVHVPRERSIDIDTLLDFKFAEFLLKNEKK